MPFALLGFGGPKYKVTLSGEGVNAGAASPGTATAGIRFNNDGTIDRNLNGSYVQIDAATDWIIPNAAASADFDVRYTGLTGDGFTSSAAAANTWINLGSNREWSLSQPGGGSVSNTVTFEIRNPGGTTVASTVYTFNATVI